MNNNLEFENEDPSPDSIEDNHPRTNYGEGYNVKETLEEAAKKYINDDLDLYESLVDGHISYDVGIDLLNKLFIEGAKWQQERSYNEEELEQIARFGFNAGRRVELKAVDLDFTFEKWFEQFKKK